MTACVSSCLWFVSVAWVPASSVLSVPLVGVLLARHRVRLLQMRADTCSVSCLLSDWHLRPAATTSHSSARVAHRPGVARGDGRHAPQRVVVPSLLRRVGRGDDAPTAPIPVFCQGAQAHRIGASVVVANRPAVARRDGCDAEELIVFRPLVWTRAKRPGPGLGECQWCEQGCRQQRYGGREHGLSPEV